MNCQNHPDIEAKWRCVACNHHFCEKCVKSFAAEGDSIGVCPSCGERCENISRRIESVVSTEPSFWERLPGIFSYPLRKDGPFVLAGGTVFFTVMDHFPSFHLLLVLIVLLFFTGYLFRYFLSVLSDSATGSSSPPTWPEFEASGFLSDNFAALMRFLAPAILSYAPATLYLVFGPREPDDTFYWLAIAGSLYYPMGLTAVAIFDDPVAVSPLLVVPSIFRAPLKYLATCFIYILILIALSHIHYVDHAIPGYLLRLLVRWFIRLYLWTMAMHLLGIFYYTSRDKLRWM